MFGPWGTVAGGVIGGVAGYLGGSSSNKVPYQPLNIDQVISQARTQAASNLSDSVSLEQQYLPGQFAARTSGEQAATSAALGQTKSQQALNNLVGGLGTSTVSPALTASTNSIMQQLSLGGSLDADTQAQATQAALEGGSTAGIAGSGSGRGLVARDLGLTSLNLLQSRQAAAQGAGVAQTNATLNDLLGRTGAATSATSVTGNQALGFGNLANQTALPVSGLSPANVASLAVGQNNAINQNNGYNTAISIGNQNSNLNAMLGLGSAIGGTGSGQGTIGAALKGLFAGGGSGSSVGNSADADAAE